MTTAVIVQARMGSIRLPGKVMRQLAGRTVLEHVLRRCLAIPGADVVVCAVPDQPDSGALEAVARKLGTITFRGSEADVLARYAGAARAVEADVVIRVTSDCPLIDPEVCGAVLKHRACENADYAANNMPPSFPHGLDCEAMTRAALEECAANAKEAYDREHVTPWLRRAPHVRRSSVASADASLAAHRWTLDHPEDLAFFDALFAVLPRSDITGMREVLAILARHPSLSNINAMHHRMVAV